jgi:hypothetical protein
MAKMLKQAIRSMPNILSAPNTGKTFLITKTFMQARDNGGWYTPFEPTEINNNYTEGNAGSTAFWYRRMWRV